MPHAQEFDCTAPIDATIRIGGGDLNITAEATQTVTVQVSPHDSSEASRDAAENTLVDFDGGRLRVEVPESGSGWIFKRSGQVRIDIRIPEESRVRAHSGSADIRITGRIGSAELTSGSGDAHIASASGDVTVKTGSGDVRSDHVEGRLRVTSGSGDLFAHTVTGTVAATTASGDVEVDDARGSVSANTASGDVRLRAVRGGEVKVNTASGDVRVGVPIGTRVWLDLNTVSGTTTSNLEMSGAAPEGGAELSLHLVTVSGDIAIDRVAAPAA